MKKKIIIWIIIGILLWVLIWLWAFFYSKYNRNEVLHYDNGQIESISLKWWEWTFLHYYGDGSIYFESYIGNRLRDLHGTWYYESWNIASIFDIDNRSWEISYYYRNWQLIRKESYKNWKPDWEMMQYYDDWNIEYRWYLIKWQKDWEQFEYYQNWQLKSKQNYKRWELDWERLYYYENWQLESKQNYKNGKRHWEWSYYYEDWQLEHQFDYKRWKIVHSITCDKNWVCE